MRLSRLVGRSLLGILSGLMAFAALAEESCQLAFDMGSSGIRAGASNSTVTTRASFDFLGPTGTGRDPQDTVAATIAAFGALTQQGGFSTDCTRVGGGFSAWRLALARDPGKLASTLAQIHADSGVAVLVIPPNVEGSYGYYGARKTLGSRLVTSHVLDIGGGSLQIAGALTSFADALGQRIWHRQLCQAIRETTLQPCTLQPLRPDELDMARALLRERLLDIGSALPAGITITAISRPVTQGVLPAVVQMLNKRVGTTLLGRADITQAIDRLAAMTLDETATQLARSNDLYLPYLLSDMLLVEGLMEATRVDELQVAQVALDNLPGLLSDDRAPEWARHYDCYLERLRDQGLEAYTSDPRTCASPLQRSH